MSEDQAARKAAERLLEIAQLAARAFKLRELRSKGRRPTGRTMRQWARGPARSEIKAIAVFALEETHRVDASPIERYEAATEYLHSALGRVHKRRHMPSGDGGMLPGFAKALRRKPGRPPTLNEEEARALQMRVLGALVREYANVEGFGREATRHIAARVLDHIHAEASREGIDPVKLLVREGRLGRVLRRGRDGAGQREVNALRMKFTRARCKWPETLPSGVDLKVGETSGSYV